MEKYKLKKNFKRVDEYKLEVPCLTSKLGGRFGTLAPRLKIITAYSKETLKKSIK